MKVLSFLITIVLVAPSAFGFIKSPSKSPVAAASKSAAKAKVGSKVASGTLFGTPMPKVDVSKDMVKTIAQAVAEFDPANKTNLFVTGKVTKVCKTKGCWLSLKSGDTEVRTLFKDYGFFVPKEIQGKTVRVVGKLSAKEISAAKARHFLKDEGVSMKKQAKVQGPQKVFEFVATGVEVI